MCIALESICFSVTRYQQTEPQVAFKMYLYEVIHKWNYILRTARNISLVLEPLERAIKNDLVPAFTYSRNLIEAERKWLKLPSRVGGLSISNSQSLVNVGNKSSLKLTSSQGIYIVLQDQYSKSNTKEIRVIEGYIIENREINQRNKLQSVMEQLEENNGQMGSMAQEWERGI